MEFCQHNTYISLLPTSFFLHVDYLHRVVLWPPMSSLIIMNNIKQKRFIIKLFCTKQARHLYNITCQQENSAENREGKIINQKIYGIWNPLFWISSFARQKSRHFKKPIYYLSFLTLILCIQYIPQVSCILCIYLPYIMLEAMTYMDEEKVLLPKNAMSH